MTESNPGENSVRIERTLRAGPERVFRAFLEPHLIRQWMAPGELVIESVSVDPKVGGRMVISHSLRGINSGSFEGEFVKILPNRELVYRWAFVGTEPEKGEYFDTLVTVTLDSVPGGKTRVTIVHEQLEDLRRRAPEICADVFSEWNKSLERMEKALQGP
jgi:uncharacterized protein YndB with AHSA1/START domain